MNQNTNKKTANNLQIGDVIQHGNLILGFYTSTVEQIEKSKNDSRVHLNLRFNHGGIWRDTVGKNAIYDVVTI